LIIENMLYLSRRAACLWV